MMENPLRALRAYLHIESDSSIKFHTGKILKTIIYSLARETQLYRGMRGIISPLHLSPLFSPGKHEWELGEVVTPRYDEKEKLDPVKLNGEYMIHIGGIAQFTKKAEKAFERLKVPLQIKIKNVILEIQLEKMSEITNFIDEKRIEGDKVTLYMKAPTKLFNVFVQSKLPKFNISAVEVLMVPYMFLAGELSLKESLLFKAIQLLGRMTETWYSVNTVKSYLIPFNDRKTPVIIGKITYILEDKNKYEDYYNLILKIAEIVGVGQSRLNGFGTVTWK